MRAVLFLLVISNAAGNLLEYNYYSEMSDILAKSTVMSDSVMSLMDRMQSQTTETAMGSRFIVQRAIASSFADLSESALDLKKFSMMFDSVTSALLGECPKFA